MASWAFSQISCSTSSCTALRSAASAASTAACAQAYRRQRLKNCSSAALPVLMREACKQVSAHFDWNRDADVDLDMSRTLTCLTM